MFKHLLVPLDGSRFGARALRYATEVAQRFGAEVILMQVIVPATLVSTPAGVLPGIGGTIAPETAARATLEEEKRNVARAKRYLSGKVRGIGSQGIKGSYNVAVGNPARSIMEFSKRGHIDLVVMTTHGKIGLKRAIMGSVADAVIRESGKPVLVTRPQSRR
jgi:nucleotide-binding universal stress UspA family protein